MTGGWDDGLDLSPLLSDLRCAGEHRSHLFCIAVRLGYDIFVEEEGPFELGQDVIGRLGGIDAGLSNEAVIVAHNVTISELIGGRAHFGGDLKLPSCLAISEELQHFGDPERLQGSLQ